MFKKIKRKYIWIGVAALVLILIGFKIFGGKNKSGYQTAYTVAAQDVRQTVLATGTVTSQSNLDLSFKSTGTLSRLNVNVGDKVRRGQILAMLDERDASAAVNQASASLLAAKANYDKVINGASGPEIDVAKAAVDAAQVTLNNAKIAYTNTVAQQQTLVDNARSAMYNSGLAAAPATTNISTATLTISGTYVGTDAGAYNITVGISSGGYTYSLSGLETYDGPITRGVAMPLGRKGLYITFSSSGVLNSGDVWTVAIPNSQSSSYVTAYNAYQSALQTQTQTVSTAKGAVDSAQAALSQAQASLNLKQSMARPEDISAAQAQVLTAQAQLQAAQNQYSNNIITAPIDGVITAVDLKLGETVSPQKAVITMLDQNDIHVESNISESSISEVKQGQDVDMTLDAFGTDRHFKGEILSVDPASTVVSGVINYRVVSSIENDPAIKPGMTVNLVILISEKNNVQAVPNRLIKTVDGKNYVTVMRGKQVEEVEVTLGLQGDTYTEVTGGLNVGDVIATAAAK